MYRLVFQSGGEARPPLEFTGSLLLIGSAHNAKLPVTGPGISPRHAVIERRGQDYYICNVSSPENSAGVRVNDQSVIEHRLIHGDQIEIGPMTMRFGTVAPARRPRWPHDPLQVVAILGIAAILVGELILVARILSEPRSASMEKQTGKNVTTLVDDTPGAPPSFLPGGGDIPATVGTNTMVTAPAVLNRMLKIYRWQRHDTSNQVTVVVKIRGQVRERILDVAAARVNVQFVPREGEPQTIWLQIPGEWDNFSAKTMRAHWPGTPAALEGFIVRTYYRGEMQDVLKQPDTVNAPAPVLP